MGPDDRLGQSDNEGNANDHGDDRRELSDIARQRDVAEAGGRHRGDSDVERVYETLSTGLVIEK